MTNLTRDLDAVALEGLKTLDDWKSLDEGVASLIVAGFAPELGGMFSDLFSQLTFSIILLPEVILLTLFELPRVVDNLRRRLSTQTTFKMGR